MYSLYINKYATEKGNGNGKGNKNQIRSILPELLGRFMRCTHYSCDLLVSPGYLSTTCNTINKFLIQIEKDLTAGRNDDEKNRKVGVGLFHGMNGSRQAAPYGPEILCKHGETLSRIDRKGCLEEIQLDPKYRNDHRKMVFFFQRDKWDIQERLTGGNLESFLDDIQVKAVLIGSSNFSWSTYYNAGTGNTAKGEADLLMFEDDCYKKELQRMIEKGKTYEEGRVVEDEQETARSGMVLFESIAGGGENPGEFFKEILRDFLSNSLKELK